jgi:hypothetical protein
LNRQERHGIREMTAVLFQTILLMVAISGQAADQHAADEVLSHNHLYFEQGWASGAAVQRAPKPTPDR